LPPLVEGADAADVKEIFLPVIRLYPATLGPPPPVFPELAVGVAVGLDVLEEAGDSGQNLTISHHILAGGVYHVDDVFAEGELAALDAVVAVGAGIEHPA